MAPAPSAASAMKVSRTPSAMRTGPSGRVSPGMVWISPAPPRVGRRLGEPPRRLGVMAVETGAQRVQGALEGAPPQRQRVQPGRAVRHEAPVRD
ncbi:hypothetical protein JBE27_47290, partial [Streptomyces albiflaviniger]|nr:hypothetical protein [Streptomyces albiflaviniger]